MNGKTAALALGLALLSGGAWATDPQLMLDGSVEGETRILPVPEDEARILPVPEGDALVQPILPFPEEEGVAEILSPLPADAPPGNPVRIRLALPGSVDVDGIFLALSHDPARATFARARGAWVVRGFVGEGGAGSRCMAETRTAEGAPFALVEEHRRGALGAWNASRSFVLAEDGTETRPVRASLAFDQRPFQTLPAYRDGGLLTVEWPAQRARSLARDFEASLRLEIRAEGRTVARVSLIGTSGLEPILSECAQDSREKADRIFPHSR